MISRQIWLVEKVKPYFMLTKPKSVFLLVFVGFAAGLYASLSSSLSLNRLALSTLSLTLGVMGANALTCYIDRDVDAVMERTKNRPLPQGEISPPQKAFFFSLSLISMGTLLAYLLSPLSSLFLLLGVLNSAVVYNRLTKRKTCYNILLGAPAGGLPILVIWSGVTGKISLFPLLLALLIVIWTPTHIWSLALFFKEDYQKAEIPMLPVVIEEKRAIRVIALSTLLLIFFSFVPPLLYPLGSLYLVTASVLALLTGLLSLLLLFRPEKRLSWILFKLTSPYLFFIFLAVALEPLV
jgi:protoheme IX farnesyltransferase